MAAPTDLFIFKIEVLDGRGFPFGETQALCVSCSFGSVSLETPYSINREAHLWNSELKWKVTRQQLRKLSSTGGSQCKVYVRQRGEDKALGWFIIDTRKAKLNSQYSSPSSEGEWFNVTGGDKSALPKTGEPPQVRIRYSLTEEGSLLGAQAQESDKDQTWPQPASRDRRNDAASTAPPSSSSYSSQFDETEEVAQGAPQSTAEDQEVPKPEALPAPLIAVSDSIMAHEDTSDHPPPPADPPQIKSQAKPPPPTAPNPSDGPFRHFSLTVDISSFHAASRSHFPLNLAHVFIQASLPTLLTDLIQSRGHRIPSRMNPLRSFPPVNIQRGCQGLVLNGSGSVEFTLGVMELARILGSDPRLNVEVWHQERFKEDTLLGVSSIPLAHLLSDCTVKGSAPVVALMVNGRGGEEEVEVGRVGTVIRLEDKGPGVVHQPLVHQPLVRHKERDQSTLPHPQSNSHPQSQPLPPSSHHNVTSGQVQPSKDDGLSSFISSFPAPAEYQAAYEVEMWKKREEQRWRDELKERESQRMSALEGEWRTREKKRETEVQLLKDEVRAIESRAKKVIVEVEERERKLLMAEEGMLRRKKEMERDHLQRMNEAEAAVRRLQVECEHQLEIERDRSSEIQRQRQALIDRISVQETRYASLEQAFQSFRESHRISRESELEWELDRVKGDLSRCEEKCEESVKVQLSYKAQMTRLVEELSRVYKLKGRESSSHVLEEEEGSEMVEKNAWGSEGRRKVRGVREGSNVDYIQKQGREINEVRRQLSSLREATAVAQKAQSDTAASATAASQPNQTSVENPPSPVKAPPPPLIPLPLPSSSPPKPSSTPPKSQEVVRLERRKEELIASGAYAADDPLIARIDDRVRELLNT